MYLEKKSNNRSKCRLRLSVIIVLFIICSTNVLAGNQKEEDLKEETKNLMSKSISDIAPKLNSFKDIKEEYNWMVIISGELSKAIPEKIDREDFIKSVHYEATRAGLDPLLVLGLIKVESAFQKYAKHVS